MCVCMYICIRVSKGELGRKSRDDQQIYARNRYGETARAWKVS